MSGYFDAAMYVILSAVAFVFLDKLCSHVDPVTALFVMSGIALISFNLLCIKQLVKTYLACIKNKLLFLLMSLALGVDWLCLTYGTYLSDPFITMVALFVTVAFLGFVKLYFTNCALSNLLGMLLLLFSVVVLYSTYQIKEAHHIVYGLILGTISGLAFFIYIILSDKLSKAGDLSTVQLLATRFWVLFIGSFFFLSFDDVYPVIQENMVPLILISFGGLIIPIFFNQQAIKKLGPARSAILISFVPSVTYFFDSWYNHNYILENLVVCILITSALVLPKIFLNPQKNFE